jgi:hypothetical protein
VTFIVVGLSVVEAVVGSPVVGFNEGDAVDDAMLTTPSQ